MQPPVWKKPQPQVALLTHLKKTPFPSTPVGISQAFGAATPMSETLTQQGDRGSEREHQSCFATYRELWEGFCAERWTPKGDFRFAFASLP